MTDFGVRRSMLLRQQLSFYTEEGRVKKKKTINQYTLC